MNNNPEKEILKLEEEYRQAAIRLDADALDRIYADDIMVTAPVGVVVDKAAAMAEARLASEKAKIESYEKEDIKVRVFGDTAVTSFRLKAKSKFDGQEVNREFHITDVWLKRQGNWQIISCHAASLEPQP